MNKYSFRFVAVSIAIAVIGLACGLTPRLSLKSIPTKFEPSIPTSISIKQPTLTSLPFSRSDTPDTQAQTCSSQNQLKAVLSDQDLSGIKSPTCYQFTITINPDGNTYSGSGTIVFTNQTNLDLSEIYLRLYPNAKVIYGGKLNIGSIQVNDQPAKFSIELPDQTAVQIPLSSPLKENSSISISLIFSGSTPIDMPDQPDYGIFNYDSHDEVLTMANWYPILAEWDGGKWEVNPVVGVGDAVVSPTSFYEVSIKAPKDWKIVSTGTNLDPNGYTAVSGPARDFAIVASPNFKVTEQETNGVQIRHWAIKGVSDQDKEMLQVARDSLDIYSSDFGQYPFNEFDMVDVPLKNASGVEYPGLILIESDLYSSPMNRSYLPLVVAHEVGHQWWYSVIGNDVLEYPWLDEGLTTFTSLLYFEQNSPAQYNGMLSSYRNTIQQFKNNGISEPVTSFIGDDTKYSNVVYLKSAVFFADVRQRIGDEKFFNALRAYFAAQKYQIAKPQMLLDAFETSCACNLKDLYQQYGALP
jgi:hypothetical protein